MAEVVRMPKMSDTMTEGVLAKWHKKVGDKVKSGDVVAEVETDKATMDFESFQEGYLLHIGVEEGQAVPVNAVIAVLGEKDEPFEQLLKEESAAAPPAKATEGKEIKEETKQTIAPAAAEAPAPAASSSDSRIKASPLAKSLAREKGIELSQIKGSAESGRIIKKDVEAFAASGKPASAAPVMSRYTGEESFEEVSVSQMRKTIAKRLAESKFTAPHFYLTMSINMNRAAEARASINTLSPVKISYNDFVIKAVAMALRQHPKVNSSWLNDRIRYNYHIHIGVAVAVEEGLLVPVLRFADNRSLSEISTEVRDFAQRAKDKKLQPSDWEGNTFTISNLGMYGIEEFTAIINPPDACILAIGAIKEIPMVINGEIRIGNEMKVTLSCDHRAVDGATGAAFLQTLKSLLEDPVRLLI